MKNLNEIMRDSVILIKLDETSICVCFVLHAACCHLPFCRHVAVKLWINIEFIMYELWALQLWYTVFSRCCFGISLKLHGFFVKSKYVWHTIEKYRTFKFYFMQSFYNSVFQFFSTFFFFPQSKLFPCVFWGHETQLLILNFCGRKPHCV